MRSRLKKIIRLNTDFHCLKPMGSVPFPFIISLRTKGESICQVTWIDGEGMTDVNGIVIIDWDECDERGSPSR